MTTAVLSERDELFGLYSDLHKDCYGFRPRGDFGGWDAAKFQTEIDRLVLVLQQVIADEAAAQQLAIEALDVRIAKLIGLGAKDRATAIRWIAEAEEVDGDMEFLCHLLGVPYGHFNQTPA